MPGRRIILGGSVEDGQSCPSARENAPRPAFWWIHDSTDRIVRPPRIPAGRHREARKRIKNRRGRRVAGPFVKCRYQRKVMVSGLAVIAAGAEAAVLETGARS